MLLYWDKADWLERTLGVSLFSIIALSETEPMPTVPNIVMSFFSPRSQAVSRPVMSPHAIAAEPGSVLLHTKAT